VAFLHLKRPAQQAAVDPENVGWNPDPLLYDGAGIADRIAKESGRRIRLFGTVWTNPVWEDEVVAIDFGSTKSSAGPFCAAVSIEK
jgi:hypothetical protein